MKKVLALVLAALMVFALVACGTSNSDETTTAANGESSAPASESESTASGDKKTLIMATNATFPPYEYKDGENFAGIDVEVAQKIAEKLGMELEIQDVEFGSIVTGVQTGKYDIGMAGISVTEDRKKSVNFSDTYATAKQVVIVTEDSSIKSLDDLKGDGSMKFGVQQDTTGDILASDTVQALKTGKVDAVIIDNAPAQNFVKSTDGLKILDGTWLDESYAIAISKDNTDLLEKVNAALKELTADGTIQAIVDKYIPAE